MQLRILSSFLLFFYSCAAAQENTGDTHEKEAGKYIYRFLPSQKELNAINTFIKNHHTNFGNGQELIQLLAYCGSLPK